MALRKDAGVVICRDDDAQEVDRLGSAIGILANENSAIFQDVEIKAAGAINTTNNASGAPVSNSGEV